MAASHNNHAADLQDIIHPDCTPELIGDFPADYFIVLGRQHQRNFTK
jgi:hypothetical protein